MHLQLLSNMCELFIVLPDNKNISNVLITQHQNAHEMPGSAS